MKITASKLFTIISRVVILCLCMIVIIKGLAWAKMEFMAMEKPEREIVLVQGVVQDKVFTDGSTNTGVGTGVGTNGVLTTAVVTTSTSDTYILFINDKKYTVKMNVWLSVEKGDKVELELGTFGGIKNLRVLEEPAIESEPELFEPDLTEPETKEEDKP